MYQLMCRQVRMVHLARGAKPEEPKKKHGREIAEITGRALSPYISCEIWRSGPLCVNLPEVERPCISSGFKLVVGSKIQLHSNTLNPKAAPVSPAVRSESALNCPPPPLSQCHRRHRVAATEMKYPFFFLNQGIAVICKKKTECNEHIPVRTREDFVSPVLLQF